MKGKKIKTLNTLMKQNVVWIAHWNRHCPVAWIKNLSAGVIHQWLKNGSIYTYKAKYEKK